MTLKIPTTKIRRYASVCSVEIDMDSPAYSPQSIFDDLGYILTRGLGTRKGSSKARQDKLSFLDEITAQQMLQYTPSQLGTILRQREMVISLLNNSFLFRLTQCLQVQAVIEQELSREQSMDLSDNLCNDRHVPSVHANSTATSYQTPINPCQYRVCSRCRRSAADRAFLSLNAVSDGEIPPTAATGYGFHLLGARPIADASVLKYHRSSSTSSVQQAKPPPSITESVLTWNCLKARVHDLVSEYSFGSGNSLLKLLETQILQQFEAINDVCCETTSDVGEPEEPPGTSDMQTAPGALKRSPRCPNLCFFGHGACKSEVSRLLWTPPPTPIEFECEPNTSNKSAMSTEVVCPGPRCCAAARCLGFELNCRH